MRKIIMMMSISLDGYFERPDRRLDWHRLDDEMLQYFNDLLRPMGAFLEGRVTYELMSDFWPTADAGPDVPRTTAEFARIWRGMPKVVYSRTLDRTDDPQAVIRREVDPEEVRALKAEPGGDLVLGGADVALAFREHDLIDEYLLLVHPVLIGEGNRCFPPSTLEQPLELIATRTFDTGVVLLRYARSRT